MIGKSKIKEISLFHLLLYSNVYISLAAFAFTCLLFIFHPGKENRIIPYAFLNFCGTFFIYNVQRIFLAHGNKENDNLKKQWYRKNTAWLFLLMTLLGVLLLFYFPLEEILQPKIILIYCVLILISLLYFLPPFPLRKIPVLKPVFIGVCWVGIGLVIPHLVFNEFRISLDVQLFIASQFFFIAALCFLFEIRDHEHDAKENVQTAAVLWGIKGCKTMAAIFFLVYAALLFFSESIHPALVCLLLLCALFITYQTKDSKKEYWYVLIIDGLIIFQSLMISTTL